MDAGIFRRINRNRVSLSLRLLSCWGVIGTLHSLWGAAGDAPPAELPAAKPPPVGRGGGAPEALELGPPD